MLELTFLGSGSAFCIEGRYWSSFLLNDRYLFDVAPTALPHLRRLRKNPADIATIFVSHFHGDHFAGLPFLLLDYHYTSQRREDLWIVGPPGVESFLENFSEMCYPGLFQEEQLYARHYLEARPDSQQEVAGLTFQAVLMRHSQKLQCFGYRVLIDGRVLAYTGDSEYSEEVLRLAAGADILIIDCTYAERGPLHMGFLDAMELRKQLPPSTTLVLTHRMQDHDLDSMENVILAQDLASYRL